MPASIKVKIKADGQILQGKTLDGIVHLEDCPRSIDTHFLSTNVKLQSFPSQSIPLGQIEIEMLVGASVVSKMNFNARHIEIVRGDFSHHVTAEVFPLIKMEDYFDSAKSNS